MPAAERLPYGRQWLEEDDIRAVSEALRSDWLTTGPAVECFERAVGDFVGARYAVAVSSGTAALHCAVYGLAIGPGDEVIVPSMTFAATANAVVFEGGTPIFADVDPGTLLMDPEDVRKKLTPRTKAILAVDYAGQPCDYDALRQIAEEQSIPLIADACHSLGATYRGRRVGTLADLTTFSFHPVKPITTGEGGMVATDDALLAARMRCFRNHGITTSHRERSDRGSWVYEMEDLGYNYRLSDFQCALGLSQLRKLDAWIYRRQEIAERYDLAFAGIQNARPLDRRSEVSHAYHLYVIRLNLARLPAGKDAIFTSLRAMGIGTNVHYIPVHLHPYYRRRYCTGPGLCPAAEEAYEQILSLPMFPKMTDRNVDQVIAGLSTVLA